MPDVTTIAGGGLILAIAIILTKIFGVEDTRIPDEIVERAKEQQKKLEKIEKEWKEKEKFKKTESILKLGDEEEKLATVDEVKYGIIGVHHDDDE